MAFSRPGRRRIRDFHGRGPRFPWEIRRPSTACAYCRDASDGPRGGLGGIRSLRIPGAASIPFHYNQIQREPPHVQAVWFLRPLTT
jgi:hypothetical protein